MEIKSILFPTDFSKAASAALPYAVDMAKLFKAKLYLVHVIPDISLTSELSMPFSSFDQIFVDLELVAQQELEKYEADKRKDLTDVEYLVARGLPYEQILRIARDKKADLIVMSSHGKSGVDKVIFGSTAQRVVRRATCPVLTVRASKK
jgi:nucleotide-binding universal stress UspA family protein